MSETPNLALPFLAAGQAQKHVTLNEIAEIMDAAAHLSVLSRTLGTPPGSPTAGARYLLPSGAAGAWNGHDGKIASWTGFAWRYLEPRAGWLLWDEATSIHLVFDGTNWIEVNNSGSIQNAAMVGVNTTADGSNRLAVKADGVLFASEGTVGHGDIRAALNKTAAGDTASLVYQTGYSGRAETGLIGNNQFSIKVSADGTVWKQALTIDAGTGVVRLPFGMDLGGAAPFLVPPQGRLTLVSGTPVMTAGVLNATAVIYTPQCGSYVPVFDGTTWSMISTGGELSQALSDSTKSPTPAIASTLYDLFVWNDAGTLRCTRGPGWTNSAEGTSTRGSGVGTTELEQFEGFWVNKHAITNGPGARQGTYVGSLKTNASANVDFAFGGVAAGGTKGVLNLWNAYNRIRTSAFVGNSTDNWTYTVAAWRQIAASTEMQVDCVQGLPGDAIQATYGTIATSSTGFARTGIGLNSTSTFSGHTGYIGSGGAVFSPQAYFNGMLPLGASRLVALEYVSVGTLTNYGDAGNPTNLQTGLYLVGQF
jgi:hypothetical protein